MNKKTLGIMNAVTFVIMIIVNIISTFGLFGVTPVKNISDEYINLLVPMGYTFSVIWTLIYAGLLYYTIKELVRKEDKYNIYWLYMISNVLNILWIVTFTTRLYLLSSIVIIGLLITLLAIDSRIYDSGLTKIVFSIYTAWILVASTVNLTTYFITLNLFSFDSLLMKIVSVLMIIITTIIILAKNNITMKITYAFALAGIVANHIVRFNSAYPIMMILVGIVIALVLFTLFTEVLTYRKGGLQNEAV